MEKSVFLYYQEGGSDKVYQVHLEVKEEGYIVHFAFGRRGTTLQTGSKTPTPVSLEKAEAIFEKLVKEKTTKGYKTSESEQPTYQPVEKEKIDTGIYCQLLNPIELEDVEKYLNDDRFLAQEKHDGKRFLISKKGNELIAINRKGLSVGYPSLFDVLKESQTDFILDGELIGEKFYVFDLLHLHQEDTRGLPLIVRLNKLSELLETIRTDFLVETVSYHDAESKRELYEKLHQQKKEGIVFKHKSALYTAGRPNSKGNQLKHKFYATASFIVVAINDKRSVALGLLDEQGKQIGAGNVTISINFDIPQVGDIIEVRYLYAFKESGSVYQPVYLGKRDDIDKEACTVSQLKYKAENEE
ncbi:MAG: WGR domain-containing protein [Raineya sp.]|jgi:bifunctional non-homologous end joining protein LigD|nr:WGR domain-containing protein [Raineya sp.]